MLENELFNILKSLKEMFMKNQIILPNRVIILANFVLDDVKDSGTT